MIFFEPAIIFVEPPVGLDQGAWTKGLGPRSLDQGAGTKKPGPKRKALRKTFAKMVPDFSPDLSLDFWGGQNSG